MKNLLRLGLLAVVVVAALVLASQTSENNQQTADNENTEQTAEQQPAEEPAAEEQQPAESTEQPEVTQTEQQEITQPEPAAEEQQPAESTDQPAASGTTYRYVAQTGDSYTKMARKAVQTYGINSSVNLSGAQIVAAETFLTNKAAVGELNLGQEVTINESDVDAAVKQAQALSADALKLWERYAARADFNTNNVGEARQ